jgi:hypothetical protein
MILDANTVFSNAQAITASAGSSNAIDLGSDRDAGGGRPIEIFAQVVQDFATLTSLQVSLQTDDDPLFATPVSLQQTAAIPVVSLKTGYQFALSTLPRGCQRYLRLYYTVAGSQATAGKITAGLVLERQTNGV